MHQKTLTILIVALAALAVGCATGPQEAGAPEVEIELTGRAYISPEASPGLKDGFVSPLNVSVGTDDAVLQHYTMTVRDSDNDVVFSVTDSVDEDQSLIPNPQPLGAPAYVRWAGMNNDREFVEEGIYSITAEFVDNVDRRGVSNTVEVVVDNTAPLATVEAASDVFSPNDDGVDDTLQIAQTGSGADRWTGEFIRTASENVVRRETWSREVQPRLIWEGMTGRDQRASAGEYRYVLTGRDLAGNSVTVETDSFLLDLNVASLDIGVSPKPFTPDGDGQNDTLILTPSVDDRSAIASWQLDIYDPRGNLFY